MLWLYILLDGGFNMTRLMLLSLLAIGLSGLAIAGGGNDQGGNNNNQGQNNQGQNVPEPSQIIGALVVVGGSALAIRGRRKK